MILAQANLVKAQSKVEVAELVGDKGYHGNEAIAQYQEWGVRTYIPERKQKKRKWTDKPPEYESAYRANRRRMKTAKGKRLNRHRSERVERTFAHVCETGGSRRSWLRGLSNVNNVHQIKCAAYNLGLLLRKRFGMRKPRNGAAGRWKSFFGELREFIEGTAMAIGPTNWNRSMYWRGSWSPAPTALNALL